VVKFILLALLGGCSYLTDSYVINDFSGDPYPVSVETTSGAVVVGAEVPGDSIRTAVLDVLSPVTIIDRGDVRPQIDYPDVQLFGERGKGGPLTLPRALLVGPQVITLHPCHDVECTVGDDTGAHPLRPFDALIGLDAFASDALRLHLAPDATTSEDQVFILPDIAGDNEDRAHACDAVLPSPFRGGGTLVIGGTEVAFTNWRIAIDTCLAPDPSPGVLQSVRGTDVLLVATTGVGVSLLDESAYARYLQVVTTAPPLDALPLATVSLPSGTVIGHKTTIPSIALAGNSSSSPRSPCRQVYASHFLEGNDCAAGDDCPCGNQSGHDLFCPAPSILVLAPAGGITFLIVPDSNDTLQALRTELRPDRPEVDGILGTDAMRTFEFDIDYPHDRALARCTDLAHCNARPDLAVQSDRDPMTGCLSAEQPLTLPGM
jgi:hypothetical protein